MKVALLPTGRTEWYGLPRAFERLFPTHEFYALPKNLRLDPDQMPNGFTSGQLSEQHEINPPEAAFDLIEKAVSELLGEKKTKADLVFIFDDVELLNIHQTSRVTAVFRRAADMYLISKTARAQQRIRELLLNRVSFHLFVPMVEALFFGDVDALGHAGVENEPSAYVFREFELEAFRTRDSVYLKADENECECWRDRGRDRKLRPKWLSVPDKRYPVLADGQCLNDKERQEMWRSRHPKAYLQWLCRDGSLKNCTKYSETEGGGNALANINWGSIVPRSAYVRAMVADMADGLGQEPTIGPIQGPLAVETSYRERPPNPVLRNL